MERRCAAGSMNPLRGIIALVVFSGSVWDWAWRLPALEIAQSLRLIIPGFLLVGCRVLALLIGATNHYHLKRMGSAEARFQRPR